jgi:hypothetical protein
LLPSLLALSFALGIGPAQAVPSNDLAKHELSGQVRSVTTKHPQLRTVHQFDRGGRLTSLDLIPAHEADSSRYLFVYDASGRLAEEQTVEAGGRVLYRKVYRYVTDDEGKPVAVVAATEEGELAHAEFNFYDRRGLLAESIEFRGSGAAEKSLYDVRGNLVYAGRYFHGRLVLEATHQHGPLGRLRESRFYGADGTLMRKDSYRYNEAGQRIEQASEFYHSSHLRKSLVSYEFDHAGNWITESVQRWTERNGNVAPTEPIVSRQRQISYY